MKRQIEKFGDTAVALRLIEDRDLAHTLEWRNRDDARIWFKTSDRIGFDGHRMWFETYLGKDDDYHFIVEAEHRAVGQCAIYSVDRDTGTAEIGRFLVAPDRTGKGYISRSCALLVCFARDVLGLRYLYLDVLEGNARARKIYDACGFVEEARESGIVRMGLMLDREV